MSENILQRELISQLLRDREAEFLRAEKAERKLKELSDVDKLKPDYEQSLSEKDDALKKKDQIIKKKDDKISSLEQQLAYLKRKVWGAMSEKKRLPENPDQLKLDFGQIEMTPEEQEELKAAIEKVTEHKTIKVKAHEKKVPKRQSLPDNLPRVEEHLYPDGYIGHEDEWVLFNEVETSEHLEYEPAKLYVRVTVRHKAMRKGTNEFAVAPVKVEPIAKSYATSSILADLMAGKYLDHLPFYRQIQRYKRIGMAIPQSTIESWFHDVADLMRPIYYRLKDLILESDYIQSDETTIPIVNNEKHKTVKGYLWLIRDAISGRVCFHYDNGSRAKEVALGLFANYKGCIQTDGYAVYDLLEKLDGITIIGCAAHSRRYFDRALTNDKARAEHGLAQFGMLYGVEDMATDENATVEQRKEYRERYSYPILKAFEKWCLQEYPKVLPKSPIGKAIGYFLNHSRQLSRYIIDGRYNIDNNGIENKVRPIACGRKNYLFCGNHDAAEDAAITYSLMGCCSAAGVDFKDWMIYFFDHIHDYDNDYSKDLAELLPDSLKNSASFYEYLAERSKYLHNLQDLSKKSQDIIETI